MNKQNFIERLNLHLDGELSEEESDELLSVVRENPEYHRIYIQYCQLFNACSELGNRFSTPGRNPAWRQKLYAVGGMAAAFALLLLAARNLTPLFDDLGAGGPSLMAKTEIPSQALGNDDSEPVMVLNDSPIESFDWRPDVNNALLVPSEFRTSRDLNFGVNSDVEFTHYLYRGEKKRPAILNDRQDFMLSEPAMDSTYAHEVLIKEEVEQKSFEINSTKEKSFGEEEVDRGFEPEKVASVRTPQS